MAAITINNISYDPEASMPDEVIQSFSPRSVEETNYILVQTGQPLSEADKVALAAAGAEILEYVPESSYVCYYPSTDLAPVRALPFVSWAGPYLRSFKIEPALTTRGSSMGTADAAAMVDAVPFSLDGQERQEVDIVFHRNVNTADQLARIGEITQGPLDVSSPGKIRVALEPEALERLARVDGVRHVEKVLPNVLFNDRARQILQLPPSSPALPLTGQGQVVAVADTGFDNGQTNDTIHPAFTGRVRRLYPLARAGNASDPHGHGTHVAGSVLGDGNSPAMGGQIQGTAPGALLVLQSFYRDQTDAGQMAGLPKDLNLLFNEPYVNDGARIHSNSWGSLGSAGTYRTNSQEVDQFVYAHRDCLIIFAAGNEGVDAGNPPGWVDEGSVSAPGTAKNCLTVGATENNRPGNPFAPQAAPVPLTWGEDPRFPHPPINQDHRADNPEGMAAFSGRGLTRNGRIKPDVVAPGTFILSTRSRNIIPYHTPSAPSADPDYFFNSGTSMAAPLVAGCAAVLREWMSTLPNPIPSPSAALMKAVIINGAQRIRGQYNPTEARDIPNPHQGFGRVNLAAAINFQDGFARSLTLYDEGAALAVGESEVELVVIPAGTTSLKVTVVWTDPHGAGLQSDLDLSVRASNGDECHGNKQVNDPDYDRANNVEQVLWQNPRPGQYQVTVSAYRISVAPQSYAMVVRVV